MNRELSLHKTENQPQTKRMLFLIEGDTTGAAVELEREGVVLTDIFPEIGVICGVVEVSLEETCRSIEGVLVVEDESDTLALTDQLRELP